MNNPKLAFKSVIDLAVCMSVASVRALVFPLACGPLALAESAPVDAEVFKLVAAATARAYGFNAGTEGAGEGSAGEAAA